MQGDIIGWGGILTFARCLDYLSPLLLRNTWCYTWGCHGKYFGLDSRCKRRSWTGLKQLKPTVLRSLKPTVLTREYVVKVVGCPFYKQFKDFIHILEQDQFRKSRDASYPTWQKGQRDGHHGKPVCSAFPSAGVVTPGFWSGPDL